MPEVTVKVNGMDALRVKLAKIAQQTPQNVVKIMQEVGSDAKDVMDSHTAVRSGTLKGNNTLTTENDGFTLSNATPYAGFVNWGTRKMAAQPFLDPAVEFALHELEARLPKAVEI